jgi:hypothetical protein
MSVGGFTSSFTIKSKLTPLQSGFGGLEVASWPVASWPLVPKFAGLHGRSRRIFRAKKILTTSSFEGEVKPSVPCRSFTACKRSLNVTCKSAFRQNFRTFLAHSFTFHRWVLSHGDVWRRLVAKVGTCNSVCTMSLRLQCVVQKQHRYRPYGP